MRKISDFGAHHFIYIPGTPDDYPPAKTLAAITPHNLHHRLYLLGLYRTESVNHLQFATVTPLEIQDFSVVYAHDVATQIGDGAPFRAGAKNKSEKFRRRERSNPIFKCFLPRTLIVGHIRDFKNLAGLDPLFRQR